MSSTLPEDALWRFLHSLPKGERRRLRRHARGTRLDWLLRVLLRMKTYSAESLRRAYRKAFPRAHPDLLRVYKQQLWNLLYEVLPSGDSPVVGQEVQIWQHFWMSMLAWHHGLDDVADILWQRAMEKAVHAGWYELALWGISLLEIYTQTPEKVTLSTAVASWSQRLLSLIASRYESLIQKLAAVENWVQPNAPRIPAFPALPKVDAWGMLMQSYVHYIDAMKRKDTKSALNAVVSMLEILLYQVGFSDIYVQIHLVTALAGLGSLLLLHRVFPLYEEWERLWHQLWERRCWLSLFRYEELNLYVLSLGLSAFILKGEWVAAYRYQETHRQALTQFIFHTRQMLLIRLRTALQVYLVLLLRDIPAAARWRCQIQTWLPKQPIRESTILWWYFLSWYEAYRTMRYRELRRTYRRMLSLWRKCFLDEVRWESLLRWMRSVSYGLPQTQRKRLHVLYEARHNWNDHEIYLPVALLIESLYRRRALEQIPVPPPGALSEEMTYRITQIFQKLRSINSSYTGS